MANFELMKAAQNKVILLITRVTSLERLSLAEFSGE